MIIKEFFIKRYGPLQNKGYTLSNNFNLILGKNEDGKTLTIDALVKLLLGRNIKDFEHIDRVEENPEGYVIIEGEDGEEIKLPEKGNLTKLAHLTPSECRNVFVIRNSDLSIFRESEFYTDVTDRLTGLRTTEISRIKEMLREMGNMTPSGTFRDTKDEKLKTRIEDAQNLISDIESLAEEISRERYDQLEEESARHREEIDRIQQKMECLEDARKREKYEKGKGGLSKLKEALRGLKDLKMYNEKDAQIWRDCDRDIQRLMREKKGLEIDGTKQETELKRVSQQLDRNERSFQALEERKNKIDSEVRLELSHYERKSEALRAGKEKDKLFTRAAITSTILLGITLIGAILRPLPLFLVLAVIFLIPAVVCWIVKFQFIREKARLAGAFERIKLTLSKFELSSETIEGILSNIQEFDEEYRKETHKVEAIRRKKEKIEEKINQLRQTTIPGVEKKMRDAENMINDTRARSQEEFLEEYTKKLNLKREHERSIGQHESVLKSHFGEASGDLEQNILHWEQEIKGLESYKARASDMTYDEAAVSELEAEKLRCEEELSELNSKLVSLQRGMGEIGRKGNEILRPEDEYLHCKTAVDLEAIKGKLQVFISEKESNKDNALEAIHILEAIALEEKEKISELFDQESPISRYFCGITDGLYEEVGLDRGSGEIEVRRVDGVVLKADKLSGGSWDQLYLSVRLALGERILKGKKGFFIMDDPFVKADPDRLQRQIEILNTIAESGWQVIYFSAKGEIKNVLQERIDRGAIHYIEIPGIFSWN